MLSCLHAAATSEIIAIYLPGFILFSQLLTAVSETLTKPLFKRSKGAASPSAVRLRGAGGCCLLGKPQVGL